MADEEYDTPIINDDPAERQQAEAVLDSIKAQINSSQFAQGMKAASTYFPGNIKSPQLKQAILDTFKTLFSNFNGTEAFVKELTSEQQSNLLAYCANVMKIGDKKACDSALNFFSLITKNGNVGSVCRVLVNRRV